MARTISKFNGIINTSFEKFPELVRNSYWVNLIWMNWRIKKKFSHMNRVRYNDNSLVFGRWKAWLIPHLITNNLALVDITFTIWWIVLMTRLPWTWTWAIEVVIWFLILVSDTTTTVSRLDKAWKVISLSLHKWLLILLLQFLFKEWNEKHLGKILISLFSGENSQLKGENKGKISLELLSMSMIRPLIFEFCLHISYFNKKW